MNPPLSAEVERRVFVNGDWYQPGEVLVRVNGDWIPGDEGVRLDGWYFFDAADLIDLDPESEEFEWSQEAQRILRELDVRTSDELAFDEGAGRYWDARAKREQVPAAPQKGVWHPRPRSTRARARRVRAGARSGKDPPSPSPDPPLARCPMGRRLGVFGGWR